MAITGWYTKNNLRLAWNRVVTGQNFLIHKNLQRLEIDAFAWTEDENLDHLTSDLNNNGFSPSRPSRFYFPKGDGFSRPITLLTIQDSVCYQALGNVVARAALPKLTPNYNRQAFSNRLNRGNSIYLFQRWQDCYRRFVDAQRKSYFDGFCWVAEFDFASYYDLISHRQLIDMLTTWGINEDILKDLQGGLVRWTPSVGQYWGNVK